MEVEIDVPRATEPKMIQSRKRKLGGDPKVNEEIADLLGEDALEADEEAKMKRDYIVYDIETTTVQREFGGKMQDETVAYAVGLAWSEEYKNDANDDPIEQFFTRFGSRFDGAPATCPFDEHVEFELTSACGDVTIRCVDSGIDSGYGTGIFMYSVSFYGVDTCWPDFENMLEAFNRCYLYAHNGGKFDLPIWLHRLTKCDETGTCISNWRVSDRQAIYSNGRWLQLRIVSMANGNSTDAYKDGILIRDSFPLLTASLAKLGKDLKAKHFKKDTVDHESITLDNYRDDREVIADYLHHDVLCLLEVLNTFFRDVKKIYDENMDDFNKANFISRYPITMSAFARSLWLSRFVDPDAMPAYTLTLPMDAVVRSCYFGGRVECRMLGNVSTKVYSYDVTSLYPYVGTFDLPVGVPELFEGSGIPGIVVESRVPGFCRCWICGFITCEVRSTDYGMTQAPLHASRVGAKLVFAHVPEWTEMTLYGKEIEFAHKHGLCEYRNVSKVLLFQESKKILRSYFKTMFQKKAEAAENGQTAMKTCYKLLLNSLYGVLGMRTDERQSIRIVPAGSREVLAALLKGKCIDFSDSGDYTIIQLLQDIDGGSVSAAISAAITSYGRMELYRGQKVITDAGYQVFYSDTDSIKCDCPLHELPEEIRLQIQPDLHSDGEPGDELGSYKDEFMEDFKDMFGKQEQRDAFCAAANQPTGQAFTDLLKAYCREHDLEYGEKFTYPFAHHEGAMAIKGCKAYCTRAQLFGIEICKTGHAKGINADMRKKMSFEDYASNEKVTNADPPTPFEDGQDYMIVDGIKYLNTKKQLTFVSNSKNLMTNQAVLKGYISRSFRRVYTKGQAIDIDETKAKILPFIMRAINGQYVTTDSYDEFGEPTHERVCMLKEQ